MASQIQAYASSSARIQLGPGVPVPVAVSESMPRWRGLPDSGPLPSAIIAKLSQQPSGSIQIPRIDGSSAIVICDKSQPDHLVVYASIGFKNLTGYPPEDAVGRNCRFLQRPLDLSTTHSVGPLPAYNGYDGRRILLKEKLHQAGEVQISLINYHRSGRAFLNGITIVSVSLGESAFYVGFLVDVSPELLMASDLSSRSISIDSSEVSSSAISSKSQNDTTKEDRGSRVFSHYEQDSSEGDEGICRDLLDLVDDLVLVLTIAGRIVYASPSSQSVLGYSAQDLQQSSLADILHPSDKRALMSELRNKTGAVPISLVSRVILRNGHSAWLDFRALRLNPHGGRKILLMLTARSTAMSHVSQIIPHNIQAQDYMNRSSWAKLSLSGIILYANLALKSIMTTSTPLGGCSATAELIGTTFQDRMCDKSKKSFNCLLMKAVRGESGSITHCSQDSHGRKILMLSDIVPGDVPAGSLTRPQFVLVRVQQIKTSIPSKELPAGLDASWNHSACDDGCIAAHAVQRQNGADEQARSTAKRGLSSNHAVRKISQDSSWDPKLPNPARLSIADPLITHEMNDNHALSEQETTACWKHTLQSLANTNKQLEGEMLELLRLRKIRRRKVRTFGHGHECANCHTKDTPEWRKGADGIRNLCNRCGLRFSKTQRQEDGELEAGQNRDATEYINLDGDAIKSEGKGRK